MTRSGQRKVRRKAEPEERPQPSVDARLFRKWRQEAGLSLREFCRRFEQRTGIGLADSNLSSMEQGHRRIPDYVIRFGAEILGKKPSDFPEYRIRNLPPEVLLDPFVDRVLRLISEIHKLDERRRAELRGSARLLELMERETSYSANGYGSPSAENNPRDGSQNPH